ncbi:hypothetical protein UPYG_G00001530 [Umbra pygmaea]|uniref:Proteolipid protein 2 n=1 Tax=Umbra pygmaea TaxID=75934 RepID=A0ABD0XGE6_UMBPY
MDSTQGQNEDFGLKFKSYLRTTKGKIYAGEIAICTIILICQIFSHYPSFIWVCICELVSATVFCIIFALELDKQIHFIHWQITDFIRAISGCLYFLITSLILVFRGYGAASIIAGLFGIVAMSLFGYDAHFILKHMKTSRQQSLPSPSVQTVQPDVTNKGVVS